MRQIVDALFSSISTGVGSKSKLRLSERELEEVMTKGAAWAVRQGYGTEADLDHIEDGGSAPGANPSKVSPKARERGRPQLGTLGSGNHFVEVSYVEEVYDEDVARAFGLRKGQMTVLIHTGSRGFGHQVCDDYIKVMHGATRKYGFQIPDRQLCCAPIVSDEGRDYLGAMKCAMNYAFANRQMITHWTREALERVLEVPLEQLQLELVYDVCHNIAKIEEHTADGKRQTLCVHRKGATRAFGPGRPEIPASYSATGQPILIPGDMGRYSYVMVGTQAALDQTFGSTCHGAGRLMSRHSAIKRAKGRSVSRELLEKGIVIRGATRSTLDEEMPEAYKDVSDVVEVVHQSGISRKVAKLVPMGCIKG